MIISEALTIIRFVIVGVMATLTHLLLATAMLALKTGMSVFLVNFFSFCGAFPISYFGHRNFTFGTLGSGRKFALAAVGGFLANTFLLRLVISILNIGGLAAIVISTLTVPIFIYIVSRLWIFR